jgi:hypothetical protein
MRVYRYALAVPYQCKISVPCDVPGFVAPIAGGFFAEVKSVQEPSGQAR